MKKTLLALLFVWSTAAPAFCGAWVANLFQDWFGRRDATPSEVTERTLASAWENYQLARGEHGGFPRNVLRETVAALLKPKPTAPLGIGENTLRVLIALAQLDIDRARPKETGIEKNDLAVLQELAPAVRPLREALEGWTSAIMVRDGNAVSRVAGPYQNYEVQRHSRPCPAPLAADEFRPVPDDLRSRAHLVGKVIRIRYYSVEALHFRVIEGEVLGSVNGRWETGVLREKNTDEIVLLSLAPHSEPGSAAGFDLFLKPPVSVSVAEFESAYAGARPTAAGSMADLQELGHGDQNRAYLVDFGTHSEVVIGKGQFSHHPGAEETLWLKIKSASSAGVHFIPHRRVLAYTRQAVEAPAADE